jgi:hypothetical protein
VSDAQQANPDQPVPGTYSLVSRRVFLRTAAGGAAGAATWSLLGARPASAQTRADAQSQQRVRTTSATTSRGPAASIVSFDTGWLFGSFVTDSDQPGFDDSALETVTLPHTVAPLSWQNWDPSTWEQAWIYRKHFVRQRQRVPGHQPGQRPDQRYAHLRPGHRPSHRDRSSPDRTGELSTGGAGWARVAVGWQVLHRQPSGRVRVG